MSAPVITLTTDFGTSSPYVAAMKGVILSIHADVCVVDVTHAISPQNVRQAAVVLDDMTGWFPSGSIHVAVIDPGVGTERGILYAEIGSQKYVCPDNGLLSRLASRTWPSRIIAIKQAEFWLPRVSKTFHGRDIMAPVAAHVSRGLDPDRLGPRQTHLVQLDWPEPRLMPNRIEGTVEAVDSFGNLITNIKAEQLADVPRGETTRVTCGEHETFGIFETYGDQPEMTLMALVGSNGHLEVAIVGESAKMMLGESVGAKVSVTW